MSDMPPIPDIPLLTGKCASEWEGAPIPEREWLVNEWIPKYTTTALYGDGGLGKSLLAMQLMTCCAGEKRFLNRDTLNCVSVGLFCEDDYNDLLMRQSAINNHYDLSFKDLSDLHYLSRVAEPDNAFVKVNNKSPEETVFFKSFRETCLRLEAKLVIVDTAADTFWGSEIDRMQVRFYVQLLNRLAREIQGSVVLLAHPSLSGMASGAGTGGSTAWNNSVRSRFYLTRPPAEPGEEPDSTIRHFSHMKANYGALDPLPTVLEWKEGAYKLKLEDNDSVEKMKERKLAKDFITILKAMDIQGRALSDRARSSNYAPKIIKENIGYKVTIDKVEKSMNYLFNNGYIENITYGKDKYTKLSIKKENEEKNPPVSLVF